jgi:hypothetical protein
MKRVLRLGAILTVALALPASAMAFTSPAWNLNGDYTISLTETVGGDGPGPYVHDMAVTFTDLGSDARGLRP